MKTPAFPPPSSDLRPDQMERVRGGLTVIICVPLLDVFDPPSATPVTPHRWQRSGPPTIPSVVDSL